MRNKKGFTLIELLAIIVILAIIAVITVPIILNIIDNAEKGSIEDSALGYKDALQKYYATKSVQNPEQELPSGYMEISELPSDFTVSGENPSDGWVKLKNGIVEKYSLKYKDYVVSMDNDKNVISEKKEKIEPHVTNDYQEVEYLESTGTQYIDTGYKPRTNSVIDVEFKSNKVSGESFTSLFGTQKSADSNRVYCLFGTNNNIQLNMPTSSQKSYVSPNKSGDYVQGGAGTLWTNDKANYKIDLIKKTFMLNEKIWDLSYYYTDTLIDSEYNLFILTRNTAGTPDSNMSKGKLYNVTIYEENSMIRNLVPVIRKSDNKPGLLDLANKTNNLFDKSTALLGYRITVSGINEQSSTACSDFIKVEEGINLSASNKSLATNYYFYDEEKAFISYTSGFQATVPENAKYVRVNLDIDSLDSYMLNVGSTTLPYEPYGYKFYTNAGEGEFIPGPEL